MKTKIALGFEIIGIRDKGDLSGERILLRATRTIEIGNIVIMVGKYSDGGVHPNRDNVYWFPDRQVNAGEYIRLYTKKGENNRTKGKFGETPADYHNFYWGKTQGIWDNEKNTLILATIGDWEIHKVND